MVETRKRQLSAPAHVVLIEVKLASDWNRRWEKPMRSLVGLPGLHVERMLGVYTGTRRYHFDGVDVLPLQEFLEELAAGGIC